MLNFYSIPFLWNLWLCLIYAFVVGQCLEQTLQTNPGNPMTCFDWIWLTTFVFFIDSKPHPSHRQMNQFLTGSFDKSLSITCSHSEKHLILISLKWSKARNVSYLKRYIILDLDSTRIFLIFHSNTTEVRTW